MLSVGILRTDWPRRITSDNCTYCIRQRLTVTLPATPTTTNTTTAEQIPDFQPPIITIIHAPAATATTITPTSTTVGNTPNVLPPTTTAPTTNDADSTRTHPHCERTFTPRIGPYVT
nr:unnamed protein product [Spirometra erinaceieuropaei]